MHRSAAAAEIARIKQVYSDRSTQVDQDLYAPWQPAENLFIAERRRLAATMLRRLNHFPTGGDKVLEIGFGKIGWLADMLSWGLDSQDLAGIELDGVRGAVARKRFPGADLRIGNAEELPWPDDSFSLVVASTVFSSILDSKLRRQIAREIDRVLCPEGTIVWYDLAVNNPSNKNVRGIGKRELRSLFPGYRVDSRSVTLAPPIARIVAPRSFPLAVMLSAIPLLRTHRLAVLSK